MKYCTHCGKELDDEAVVCPGCGCPVNGGKLASTGDDTSNKALFGILSFLFPIVGLILFLIWKNERPTVAKTSGVCALVSFILSVVSYIIFFMIGLGAAASYGFILI